jgi:hypothetical protein
VKNLRAFFFYWKLKLALIATLVAYGMTLNQAVTTANRNAELDALLRATAFTGVAALFLSIHTADPGNTGASEYTTYTGTRPSLTFSAAAAAATASTNLQDFVNMGATTITHFGIWSLTSGGVFQGGGTLAASKTTTAGDTLRFAIGAITAAIT